MSGHPAPRSEDTFDVIGDAPGALAQRRGPWIGDDHVVIHLLASLIDQAERCLPEIVTNARANGSSRHDIAQMPGNRPDEPRLRFDPDSPIADGRWPLDVDRAARHRDN